jgi:GT2 family glycosyltransferase
MNNVKITIPFFNSVEWLSLCLESISISKFDFNNVIVCDDGSSKDQLNIAVNIIEKYQGVALIKNKGRKGYGGVCNYVANTVESEFILFLNTDCLITPSTINALIEPLKNESGIILSCPVSNNSPNYSFPIPEGLNFYNFAEYLSNLYKNSQSKPWVTAVTIVGNCLMANRDLFNKMGGFLEEWGLGYGEETDLQFRAMEMGYDSVVCLNTYVYHFGGGSFNSIKGIEDIRKNNNNKFNKKWKKEYLELIEKQCFSPINLFKFISAEINLKKLKYDAIFYLPIIDQESGGNHNIIDACNELILNGKNATCALVGNISDDYLFRYKEMMLFNPLKYKNDDDFIFKAQNLQIKILISGLHTSAKVFASVKCDKHYQYIQGVEYMFENGLAADECLDSYKVGENFIFASKYLEKKISPMLTKIRQKIIIPPLINQNIFYKPLNNSKKFKIGFCLRGVPDKGQGYLINLLTNKKIKFENILVFGNSKYKFLTKYFPNITFIELPISRSDLAHKMRDVENYIDLSSHEGYGLMGHEALKCGANLFYTNYGGLQDYVVIESKFLISDPFDSDTIIEKIKKNKTLNKVITHKYAFWKDLC